MKEDKRNECDRSGTGALVRKRILIVDDDPSIRQMLTRLLADEGYAVWAAANGTAALEITVAAEIDLVLLDLNMPGMSGWNTFEELTRDNPLLSVIIVTAAPQQLFTAVAAGAAALMEKPLDFRELLETIRNSLAETPEERLARMAGKTASFHYQPGRKPGSGS